MADEPGTSRGRLIALVAITIVVTAAVAAALTALLVNIFERRQEGRAPFHPVVAIDDETVDPAIWGRNFPIQYDLYRRTVDQVRTRYGGSEALPRVPDHADPRSVVAQSRLDEDSRLRTMWAGYAFAADFREERGHAYMLEDQIFTQRQVVARQPGTCLHCHASVYVAYKRAGEGDLIAGFERINRMPYEEAVKHVQHPVSCIDCHEPESMALRITRPGFLEGIRSVKAAQGIEDYDVNTMASRQEMRSFVCGQCHVEYYFRGAEKRLTYPWARGLRATDMIAYYDTAAADHADWRHELTGAPVLKAQHPEFELWSQGIHARSGVACPDCHMPYVRVGAMKVSDHHVRSPMLNVGNACQTCHHWSEQELMERVHVIQDRTHEMRNAAIDALLALIDDIRKAIERGAPEPVLDAARAYQRRAQFLVDFIEAENSMGFHADQEAARVLLHSIDQSRRGQTALRDGRTAVDPFAPSTGTMGLPPTAEEAQRRAAREGGR
ncbi:MAG TPA: ammonia-forming cytochrome c nitrite reductase subunit c552 [Thermoanaerobaculia bacterium]|nr:ammonia-forming cytochrome c nitrite reductase subunit c552 [Thermoanaerobaculia bacterium]